MTDGLVGQELVAYVWAAVDGPIDAIARIRALWKHCVKELAPSRAIGALPEGLPDDVAVAPTSEGDVLAAVQHDGASVHQIVLRRVHDVLVLGLLRAPAAGDPGCWTQWEQDWDRLLGAPDERWLGSVRILQCRRRASGSNITIDQPLQDLVQKAARLPSTTWSAGTLEVSTRLGAFAIWEASTRLPDLQTWDARAHRRLVIVAPAEHDHLLSAWTWSRGTPELAPLAAYLMHAATLRYALRLLPGDHERRALLHEVDTSLAELVALVAAPGNDDEALIAASATVRAQQARELGLVATLGTQRRLASAVDVATRNMANWLGIERPGGVFADDGALATWLADQLRVNESVLRERLERGRSVTAQADQVVQRHLQDRAESLQVRRERSNLTAAGAVGAVLMALAAIQALAYQAPVPGPVQGPTVAVLGCFALLCSALVLRVFDRSPARPQRRSAREPWAMVLIAVTSGLLGASAGWCVVSVLAQVSGRVAPAGDSGLGASVGGVIALAVVAVVVLLRRRAR